MAGRIESVLFMGQEDRTLRNLDPDTDWGIFHTEAMVVISVVEERQGSSDPAIMKEFMSATCHLNKRVTDLRPSSK